MLFFDHISEEDRIRDVYERIGYRGQLEEISHAVCNGFGLGKLKSNNLIIIGYGDFNFSLETSNGIYFVKVFANSRDDNYCERFVKVVTEAVKAKVRTPKLYESEQGFIHRVEMHGCNLRVIVMEYINGQDFYSTGDTFKPEEVKSVARQAAQINSIDFKPSHVYGSWSVQNFLEEFGKTNKMLSADELALIQPLVKEYENLRIEELPHCMVHGDLVSSNIMKDEESLIWIIDFGMANYSPRIEELANMDIGLLINPDNEEENTRNRILVLEEYQKIIKLTEREWEVLPTYTRIAHAMGLMGTSNASYNSPSEENKYWYSRAKAGLEEMVD